jgi:spore coat polysaccharide biosynthesis protein SpsF (cytidylyltransferase family)
VLLASKVEDPLLDPKIGIGIQARSNSSRLPQKIFKEIRDGVTVLDQVIKQATLLEDILFLEGYRTSICLLVPKSQYEEFKPYAEFHEINLIAGSLNDVLSRYDKFNKMAELDYLIRITGDCPLFDPSLSARLALKVIKENYDYGIIDPDIGVDGLDTEIFRTKLIPNLYESSKAFKGTLEHVTTPLRGKKVQLISKRFVLNPLEVHKKYSGLPKMSIDTNDDLNTAKFLIDKLSWIFQ